MTTITTPLPARIVRTIREKRLLSPGDTVIVALSGGADSTALLDICSNLPDFPLQLVAAHLNHCLRGAESDSDETFARELAGRHGIPFESRRVDVTEVATRHRLNLEDAGRQARITFFDELRERWQATAIALAHHSDDQAETILMRLLRGSGSTGLSGMLSRNDRGYIRPLLGITRLEIEAYLAERGITWREDASNRNTVYLRNRIRHELLPLLETYNPTIRERLAATSALLAEEDALLKDLADSAFARICSCTDSSITCNLEQFSGEHPALRRRILRRAVSQLAGTMSSFAHVHSDALERLACSARPNAMLALPQGLSAVREYGVLHIRKNRCNPPPEAAETVIPGPGQYQLPGGFSVSIAASAPLPPDRCKTPSTTAHIDIMRAPFPWHVRTFRHGDRMTPLGMTGTKKVKNLFIDEKIPMGLRSRIPLFFSNGVLIWAGGVRISANAGIDRTSSSMVKAVLSCP